jgi:hypothetical protein
VRLVVHAVEALHDGLLDLVDHLGALAVLRVDAVDALVWTWTSSSCDQQR